MKDYGYIYYNVYGSCALNAIAYVMDQLADRVPEYSELRDYFSFNRHRGFIKDGRIRKYLEEQGLHVVESKNYPSSKLGIIIAGPRGHLDIAVCRTEQDGMRGFICPQGYFWEFGPKCRFWHVTRKQSIIKE